MKQIIFLVMLAFLVTACNNKRTQTDGTPDSPKLSFSTVEFQQKSKSDKFPESEIEAKVPVAEGNSAAAEKVNKRVFDAVKSVVGNEKDSSSNFNALFSNFISGYEKFMAENPDSPGDWEAEIKGSVEYNTPHIANIRLESYAMTGGAHGNSVITSLIFDPATGRELSVKDLINNIDFFTAYAEKKFREKYDVPADKPINSTGLMFENDKFVISKNIFVSDKGLKLLYNNYEIAPYVDGTRDLDLPYDEIKNYLLVDIR